MNKQPKIIEVVVPLHLERIFHYLVPAEMEDSVVPGKRVFIPFGGRRMTGYVVGYAAPRETSGLKQVLETLDDEILWTDRELEFFRWVAAYYLHPLGEVLKTALPAGINRQSRKHAGSEEGGVTGGRKIKREKYYRPQQMAAAARSPGDKALAVLEVIREAGDISAPLLRKRFGLCSPQLKRLVELGLVAVEEREVFRDPFRDRSVERDTPRSLDTGQDAAFTTILQALDNNGFAPFLLHGVTGSGKTEVYLQSISAALDQGGNALVLVPEISLTPQLVLRFRQRFGAGIAILHSKLSDGERYDEWRRIRRGMVRIVIGARSAIFAPLEKIGIIVVDEEHEASFKQSDSLRYNARDLALVRGRMERAVVVLGSATPLVTSRYAVETGKLTLLRLPERVAGRPMPDVAVIPARERSETISTRLKTALGETLEAGGQAIVFHNRRGFATFLVCGECGQTLTCPNCSVTLTFHRQRGQSVCHYCDYAIPAPGVCPACGGKDMRELGMGTERAEHELRELFPNARILRMDSDTTSGRDSHERILAKMADGTADILTGTQMIAKGHDFPGVTLVGVLNAETNLNMPDFRSAERTFQLLSQVIGRAGRGDTPGRVLIQSLNPGHYAVSSAAGHDYEGFYLQELEFRREAGYPPFVHLVSLGFSGISEQVTGDRADAAANGLRALRQELKLRVEILGPAQAPLYRLRGRFRRQILLKAPSRNDLRRLVAAWLQNRVTVANVRETVDIDPVDMM